MSVRNVYISADALLWWIEGCGLVALNCMQPFATGKSDMASSFEDFKMRTERVMQDLLRDGPSHKAEKVYRDDLKSEELAPVKTRKLMGLNQEAISDLAKVCAETFVQTMAISMYMNGNKRTAWDDFVAQTSAIVGTLPGRLHARKILGNRQKAAQCKENCDKGVDIGTRR